MTDGEQPGTDVEITPKLGQTHPRSLGAGREVAGGADRPSYELAVAWSRCRRSTACTTTTSASPPERPKAPSIHRGRTRDQHAQTPPSAREFGLFGCSSRPGNPRDRSEESAKRFRTGDQGPQTRDSEYSGPTGAPAGLPTQPLRLHPCFLSAPQAEPQGGGHWSRNMLKTFSRSYPLVSRLRGLLTRIFGPRRIGLPLGFVDDM